MHVGVLGPVSLQALGSLVEGYVPATDGLRSPLITDLVLATLDRGHDVSVFTLSSDERDVGGGSSRRLNLHVARARPRGRARDAFHEEIAALADAVLGDPPDVLHAHWTYEFALAALRSPSPSLVTVHDWAPKVLAHQPSPYRVVRAAMQATVLRRAPHLTAVSPHIQSKVRRRTGKRVQLIPNGIRAPSSLPPAGDHGAPTLCSINNGFGRLKNVATLLRAFEVVKTNCPSARLRLIGDGYEPLGPAYRFARDRGLADGVDFVGPIPHPSVIAELRAAEILVHPSLEESFGMTLVEAMAHGAIVVAGRRSGAVPWILDGGEAGVLTDVHDASALAATLIDLVSSRDDWSSLRRRAFEHVSSSFGLDGVVDRYCTEYEQIVTQRRE